MGAPRHVRLAVDFDEWYHAVAICRPCQGTPLPGENEPREGGEET